MPATYENIATTTVTASSGIAFTSISSSFTDLVLVCSGKDTGLGGYMNLRFNSDSGNNYSRTILRGDGSNATSTRTSNNNAAYPDFNGDPTTVILNIMNYSNTTTNKTIISRSNSNGGFVAAVVNLWRSTSAINRIDLTPGDPGNTLNGTFTLYGIKAA